VWRPHALGQQLAPSPPGCAHLILSFYISRRAPVILRTRTRGTRRLDTILWQRSGQCRWVGCRCEDPQSLKRSRVLSYILSYQSPCMRFAVYGPKARARIPDPNKIRRTKLLERNNMPFVREGMLVHQLIQERISPPDTTALTRLHALQQCGAPGSTTTVAARSSTTRPTTPAVAKLQTPVVAKLEKRAAAKLRRQADEKARHLQSEAEDAADQRLGELEQRVRRQVEERATRRGAQAARCEAEVEVSKAEERAAAAERKAGVAEARAMRLQQQLNAMRRKVLQSAPGLRGRVRTRVRVSTRRYKRTNQRAHQAGARARAHARARRAGTTRPRVAREG